MKGEGKMKGERKNEGGWKDEGGVNNYYTSLLKSKGEE